jgi:transcriptional regulator
MYSPPYNRLEDRAEQLAFMRENGFALLVTGTGGALHASHLPVVLDEAGGRVTLHLHMARGNPQWKEFFADEEVLVVFSGPHAYVSPRWYEEAERVPTWNYAALHAYGAPRVIEDRAAKHAAQRRLVAELDPQWLPKFDALREDYVTRMLEGIVAFDVALTRIETRWKLSQNRSRREQELIAAELEKSADSGARALAVLTRRHLADQ